MVRASRVRARLAAWPYEPNVTHVILVDHHMVPTRTDVTRWVTDAISAAPGLRAIRTGAMFPDAAAAFRAVGFRTIDTLALLEAPLVPSASRSPQSPRAHLSHRWQRRDFAPRRLETQRLRAHHLPDVALLDRRAFGDPWGNDVRSLHDIIDATPRHRARIVTMQDPRNAPGERRDKRRADRLGGFAITGQSGTFGYLQRLAVDPELQRQGVARRLVEDSLQWMRRCGATTAMVNTALDNAAALALYAQAGFRLRSDTLTILELSGRELAARCSNALAPDVT